MEVHHHTHHPKSWKEYLQEFLMLFFAVFLGFMSEYYLEYRAERHKEHDYLNSMLIDLQSDLKEVDIKNAKMEDIVSAGNKISDVIYKPTLSMQDIDTLYASSEIIISRVYNIDFSTGTIDQLRNAGGFRLIQNESIVRKISDYEKGKITMQVQLDEIIERAANVHRIQNRLLHISVFTKDLKSSFDKRKLATIKNQTGSVFLTSDKNVFFEYANYVNIMTGYIAQYERMAKAQQQKAQELIALIQEELAH
jgi:hypothetical protein